MEQVTTRFIEYLFCPFCMLEERIVVGFPPGGSTNTVARVLVEKMSVVLKQPIIVDNKPGRKHDRE